MLTINYSKRFKNDYKLVKKRGYDIRLMEEVLEILCAEQPLPGKYRDHALSGNYNGQRECHITPDWLLIYEIADAELILNLTRTGTHSDLF
jgi:mRNA interferase YafQ